jgi:hypothetical protein
VGLSETAELYNKFFDVMDSLSITREMFADKRFLTNQHKVLRRACAGRNHFFCYRHLIENFGSKSPIAQIVRRLAFSSTPAEFLSQVSVSVYDLLALQQRGALDEKQVRRLYKRFGTITPDGQMIFNIETWIHQAIWTRAQFGVSTCTNHIEGWHRALNEKTSHLMRLTRRLRKVIKLMVTRYHLASEYKHTQGTRLLKKLEQQQKSWRLQQCEECRDEKCGWKNYFSALLCTNFPCVHEVGSRTVSWFQPEEEQTEITFDDVFQMIEYGGTWDIPHSDDIDCISENSFESEWYRDSVTRSAFIEVLAREVTSISRQHIPNPHMIATLGACYAEFLGGGEDNVITRSNFRAEWWIKAEIGDIEVW